MDRADLDFAIQRAWPPRATASIGPWTARLDAGVTRRPNSVSPHGQGPEADDDLLDGLLTRTVGLYDAHGLVPWVQVSEAAWPPRLNERLASRGWLTGIDRTLLLTGPLPAGTESDGVCLEPRHTDEWLSTWWSIDPRGEAADVAAVAALLTRIQVAAFARVVAGAETMGVAVGVLVGDTLVLECVATQTSARRRGVATRAISALAGWAAARGGRQTLLAVQESNAAARSLYARLGLRQASSYAYARPAGRGPGAAARDPREAWQSA